MKIIEVTTHTTITPGGGGARMGIRLKSSRLQSNQPPPFDALLDKLEACSGLAVTVIKKKKGYPL
jgi:hypothetical protein